MTTLHLFNSIEKSKKQQIDSLLLFKENTIYIQACYFYFIV